MRLRWPAPSIRGKRRGFTMNRSRLFFALVLSISSACGGDDDGVAPPVDAGSDAGFDAGVGDAGVEADSGSADADTEGDAGSETDADTEGDAGSETDAGLDASVDSGTTDAGADDDAGIGTRDAGPGACHSLDFGADEVPLRRVDMLPTMTGGTIPDGVYDAIDYQTTAGLMGAYRGTWHVRSTGVGVGTMDVIQQLTVSGAGPIVPRTMSWTASGTALARTETCPTVGAETNFTYSVETEGGTTRLLARSDTLLFVLERR